jgi:hypothetical protein
MDIQKKQLEELERLNRRIDVVEVSEARLIWHIRPREGDQEPGSSVLFPADCRDAEQAVGFNVEPSTWGEVDVKDAVPLPEKP